MARLNELPLPTESVESLKRRFVRQNRDLARSNSIQSIKIRGLETDISRLLEENVSLRQQNIQMQTELDNSRYRDIASNADAVKARLEAKLQEFHGLLAELGDLKKKHRRRTSHIQSSDLSPKSRFTRPVPATLGAPTAQDGRLPTIVEDKYYPRKTMEAMEIQQLLCDTPSDSPDIGPPPRTFFDREDPDSLVRVADEIEDGPRQLWDDNVRLLSANFDTRRRRRETHVRSDFERPSVLETSPAKEASPIKDQIPQPGQPFRAGVKRKLDVCDLKVGGFINTEDNFTYSRKDEPSTLRNQVVSHDATKPAEIKSVQNRRQIMKEVGSRLDGQTSPIRTILGPKSVNADPVVSPRKKSQSAGDDHVPDKRKLTKSFTKPRSRDHNGEPTSFAIQPLVEAVVTTAEIPQSDVVKLEPKTPGLSDLWSPSSTQPSEARPESKDTPPPPDLASRLTGGDDAATAGRGSRRGRSNVSYAEPSLNSKMRRPTKDLVDAVGREDARSITVQRHHDHVNVKQEEKSASVQKPPMRTIVIAKDDSYGNAWTRPPEPTSPLVSKEKEPGVQAVVPPMERLTSRERRRTTIHIPSSQGLRPASRPSASSTTISTLLSGPRKRPDETQQENIPDDALAKAMEQLDICNVQDSSPAGTLSDTGSRQDTKHTASKPSAANLTKPSTTQSGLIVVAKPSATVSRASTRRQTMGMGMGAGAGTGAAKPSGEAQTLGVGMGMGMGMGSKDKDKDKEVKSVRSSAALSNNNTTTAADASASASAVGRAERVAARRRSMVV